MIGSEGKTVEEHHWTVQLGRNQAQIHQWKAGKDRMGISKGLNQNNFWIKYFRRLKKASKSVPPSLEKYSCESRKSRAESM